MSEKKKKVKRWAGRELKRESLILEKFFRLTENKADITTELLAGVATFITVAYILAVNPDILAASGMPKGGVFIATALAAAVGSALMGFFANYPFVLAPGLGINAFFSYTVVLMMGYSWQFALLTVFVEGIIFLVLSVTSIREKLFNSIPFSLKAAVAVGIGLLSRSSPYRAARSSSATKQHLLVLSISEAPTSIRPEYGQSLPLPASSSQPPLSPRGYTQDC
jgi:AGZA family xanthine/uracil permease-like MFS transporter